MCICYICCQDEQTELVMQTRERSQFLGHPVVLDMRTDDCYVVQRINMASQVTNAHGRIVGRILRESQSWIT